MTISLELIQHETNIQVDDWAKFLSGFQWLFFGLSCEKCWHPGWERGRRGLIKVLGNLITNHQGLCDWVQCVSNLSSAWSHWDYYIIRPSRLWGSEHGYLFCLTFLCCMTKILLQEAWSHNHNPFSLIRWEILMLVNHILNSCLVVPSLISYYHSQFGQGKRDLS